jgi:hypothetical protein
MRQAFATYADRHEAASIRRCRSTWNTLCRFLFSAELLTANPMQLVGRPKLAKTLPKSLPRPAVEALLNAIVAPAEVKRRSEWPERDHAIILEVIHRRRVDDVLTLSSNVRIMMTSLADADRRTDSPNHQDALACSPKSTRYTSCLITHMVNQTRRVTDGRSRHQFVPAQAPRQRSR